MYNINLIKLISKSSQYGVVWLCNYNKIECVIKIVKLNIINNDKYNKSLNFEINKNDFNDKKKMDIEKFKYEVKQLKKLSSLKLSPLLHNYDIIKNNNEYYGFIIMDKMDCTFKDIILKRNFTDYEYNIIKQKINKLHKKNLVHGDMKASNIGVMLDENGFIKNCLFLDCAKIKKSSEKLIKKDKKTLKKHISKNILERNNI